MRHIHTDILVIGGGATGTGIIRDLVMRGFNCTLVERRDLAYGTTGRYHGLLHSGGRYVVKDPLAARECIEENTILRRIMPQCIEDTGGFFVLTPEDDPTYVSQFIEGCHKAGISIEEISVQQMLKEEPALDPQIRRCFRVPDASADSFLAADINAESARQHGALVLLYHEVTKLILNSKPATSGKAVIGALCHDVVKDEDVQISASVVINASGAWAGIIASLAGITLQMLPGKGTMVALNHRVVNTVINRCKLPSDGDILVPAHSVAVMGTTDIRVTDPDHYPIEPWEIRLMLDEGEKFIPRFKEFRILRAWAGVRPLIQDSSASANRDISRAFTLLDHAARDGIEGFITITSGKWTTYRKMSEATVDKLCEKLNTTRECRTHLEILPSPNELRKPKLYPGAHLEKVEDEQTYGQLVCECELVTRDDVERSIIQNNAVTFDDIRRDVRLGMGPCQAAFCAFRAAGLLHGLRHPPVADTNISLRNFLQERWKGNLPILWGQQLRQERFNELIYINNLNINELPGEIESRLSAESYTNASDNNNYQPSKISSPIINKRTNTYTNPADVVIIGSGLSGLIAGWRTSAGGNKTHIITKGWGATYWSSGCIDIFGYSPTEFNLQINSPRKFLVEFIKSNPNHPYALVGIELLEKAVSLFIKLSEDSGYPYHGSLNTNILLPTALGTLRPTCLVPFTMTAGDTSQRSPMLIVGFSQYLDFYPAYIADNLNAQDCIAKDILLELKSLQNQKFISAMVLARLFDKPEFRQEVIETLKPKLGSIGRIGFPAVLGFNHSSEVIQHLESSLGIPVFEITGLPPSIPGIRLHNMLTSAIERQHGSINNGMTVSSVSVDNQSVSAIWSDASARQFSHPANNFFLATGGILGGGVNVDENGYAQDMIFGIPIDIPKSRSHQFQEQFLSRESHPIHTKGLEVDSDLHPLDEKKQIVFRNLYAVGSAIGNCDPIRERSLEGIALATSYKAGESLSQVK
jgi:glycerol-3-phosphate dehydrogenase